MTTIKKSRGFDRKLDCTVSNSRMNAAEFPDVDQKQLLWMLVQLTIDLNFEIQELREELHASKTLKVTLSND